MPAANRYWLIVVALLLASFVTGSMFLLMKFRQQQFVEITLSQSPVPEHIGRVYVDGAVASPGFYALNKGDTIEDIVLAAGASTSADWNHIRLYIPGAGETKQTQKVNLNLAEAWLIAALPGIGPETAQAIVDYRNRYGPFRRIEDLLQVKGIGNTTLSRIKDLVTLEE